MNIIFIAPPAAGKGTQSELLREKYGLKHISTGDLLREEVNKKSELGLKIEDIMNSGQLVSDDIMIALLKQKIETFHDAKGIIFDGFPRTDIQAEMLDDLLRTLDKSINHVLYLKIDKEEAMKRALGRITCPKCGKIYNTYFDEFKVKGYCNECNSLLEKREDDTEEKFITRFESFIRKTEPLVNFYKNKGLLYEVQCGDKKEQTFSRIESIIDN